MRRRNTSTGLASMARTAERVTPKEQPGTHDYEISPDGRWAVHHYSTANMPPIVELIRLPGHERVKLFTDNAALKKKLAELEPVKTEFFRVDIGGGVTLDGWCMLPPRFDPQVQVPIARVRLRRAGRHDGGRPMGRWRRALASHASRARLRGDELRQPRHARAQGTGLAEGRAIARSASSHRRSRPLP